MAAAPRETIYVLDVSFFTFRAYYALPPLSTSAGLPTNAVHGVASMLERLVREEHPRYLAAAFDAPGKTFRSDIYPQYKANRDEPDEDLRLQFPLVRRLIAAMAIRGVEVEGFEADDILATLADRFAAQGHDVVIVTGDKDLMQCVNEHVSLYDPVKGVRVREPEVEAKFGVEPEAVTDVQALMGDSTDNIPGIKGIGPKTAMALIQHFGSLDKLLAAPEEIEKLKIRGATGIRKKVESSTDAARISKELAVVRRDVPIDLDFEDFAFDTPHTSELLALAEELEMERTAARIRALLDADSDDASSQPARSAPQPSAGATAAGPVATPPADDLEVAFESDWKSFAEALGEESGSPLACVIADGGPTELPLVALSAAGVRLLLEDAPSIRGAMAALGAAGLSPSGYDLKRLCREYDAELGPGALDVGVASYLYDPSAGDHSPADVVRRFLDEDLVTAAPSRASMAPALAQLERLLPRMREALAEHGQENLYKEIELPLIGILGRLEAHGILLDTRLLAQLSRDFEQRMQALVKRVYEAAQTEFNILSPVQLREILFEKLGLPSKGVKKTKTGPSTDSDTLQALADQHPLPGLVLEYRGLAKLKSTYVDALPRLVDAQSRIHTRLNQTVTATGRLSSKDPNLQNIPIRTEDGVQIRKAFVAGEGSLLVSADYNQIELRVLAHLAEDAGLIEAFAQGLDIHVATAADVFEVEPDAVTASMRRAAKVINYGIIYGMGPVRMSRELGIPRTRASAYIERYFERYAGVRKLYERTLEEARRQGYVSTLLGRRRYLPDLASEHGGLRQAAERVATNTPIQGSAADIIKTAMVRLEGSLAEAGVGARLVLQIHDELLVECPERELDQAVTLVRDAMEGAAELVVPLVVDIGSGPNWAAAH
jgi:DNA polymerase-1